VNRRRWENNAHFRLVWTGHPTQIKRLKYVGMRIIVGTYQSAKPDQRFPLRRLSRPLVRPKRCGVRLIRTEAESFEFRDQLSAEQQERCERFETEEDNNRCRQ
jgi:hypothetical protein